MRKLLWLQLLIIYSCLFACMPRAMAAENPINMLNSVANQMISGLKTHQMTLKSNPTQVYSLAYKIIVPHADLDYMSKRVLPPQIWNKASTAERTQFKQEFTTLLVRTYASALADYTDQTVRFYPIRGSYQGKSTLQVNSQIVRNDGPSIPVAYSLVADGSQWKLYDMSVEGISMLQSFRSQFADKLAQGTLAQLTSALKTHNRANSGG